MGVSLSNTSCKRFKTNGLTDRQTDAQSEYIRLYFYLKKTLKDRARPGKRTFARRHITGNKMILYSVVVCTQCNDLFVDVVHNFAQIRKKVTFRYNTQVQLIDIYYLLCHSWGPVQVIARQCQWTKYMESGRSNAHQSYSLPVRTEWYINGNRDDLLNYQKVYYRSSSMALHMNTCSADEVRLN